MSLRFLVHILHILFVLTSMLVDHVRVVKSNTIGVTSGTEAAYKFEAPEFTSRCLIGFVFLNPPRPTEHSG